MDLSDEASLSRRWEYRKYPIPRGQPTDILGTSLRVTDHGPSEGWEFKRFNEAGVAIEHYRLPPNVVLRTAVGPDCVINEHAEFGWDEHGQGWCGVTKYNP